MRPELKALPRRMQNLPLDSRGYPVPWFVQWVVPKDGGEFDCVEYGTPGAVPEFRAMDAHKWVQALKENRCWVCGQSMGVYKTFVVGPMCGINRTTAEPPNHKDCAEWSAENCPFLVRPQMVRRQHEDLIAQGALQSVGGNALTRNPGVTLLWTTKRFKVWSPAPGQRLIEMGEPTEVRFYTEGRAATREEVEASVAGGYPSLLETAEQQDREEGGHDSVKALEQSVVKFWETCFPKEGVHDAIRSRSQSSATGME